MASAWGSSWGSAWGNAWGSTTPIPTADPYYQPFGGPKSEYFDWTPHRKKAKRIERERLHRDLALFLLMME